MSTETQSEPSDLEKIEALLRITGEGTEHLNAAEALIMASRSGPGKYELGEEQVSMILRNFGVVGRCLEMMTTMYRLGAQKKGIELSQQSQGEDMKQPQLSKLVAATQEAVTSGFGAGNPNSNVASIDQAKRVAAERQRTSLIKAFGPEITANGVGPVQPGFRGLGAYKDNLLSYDPETLTAVWPNGFYGKDSEGKVTQFFLRTSFQDKEVLFLFVVRDGVAELNDKESGDLYIAGDGFRFNGTGMTWLPVNNFSMTPAMQLRGVYARAVQHLIVS